jgi:hypothetical protein
MVISTFIEVVTASLSSKAGTRHGKKETFVAVAHVIFIKLYLSNLC